MLISGQEETAENSKKKKNIRKMKMFKQRCELYDLAQSILHVIFCEVY